MKVIPDIPKEMKTIIDVEAEKDKALVQFAKERKAVLLAMIASYVPRRVSPAEQLHASLGLSEEFGVETVLSRIQDEMGKDISSVYFLVNSPGGTLFSSYKTAKAIRESFKNIKTFVPHTALSGGTLLALTGNKITMGVMSQLSGLDIQTNYRDTTVSVNAMFRAKGKLDSYFARQDVANAPYTWKLMAEKIDPVILEDWDGDQRAGLEYVTEILEKSGYGRKAGKLARTLTYDVPTHGYIINFERAKEMGLNVVRDSEDPEAWKIMRYWLGKYMIRSADKHFVRCVTPKIEKKKA